MNNIKILNMFYGSDVVNSIFIHESDTLVIIDTGIKDEKEKLLKEISEYRFKKLFVILTHAHPDHIGNNHAIKKNYNPIFVANIHSKKQLENYNYQFNYSIEKSKDLFKITKEIKDFYFGFLDKEVKIDISFYDQMVIDLEGRILRIIHLPGHTLSDIGIWDKKYKTLILSELVFEHSRNLLVCVESYKEYKNSLNIIKELVIKEEIEYLITSHHERALKGKEKILDIIDYNIDYVNELKLDIDKLYIDRLSIEDIAKEVCRKYEKEYTYNSIETVKCMVNKDVS